MVRTGQALSGGLAAVTAKRLRSSTVCFSAGHIPSWCGSCERYALAAMAARSRWLSLLLSLLLSTAGPVPRLRGFLLSPALAALVAIVAALPATTHRWIRGLNLSLRREHAAVRNAAEVAQHAYLSAVMADLVQGRRDDRRAICGRTRLIAVGVPAGGSL